MGVSEFNGIRCVRFTDEFNKSGLERLQKGLVGGFGKWQGTLEIGRQAHAP